MRKLLVILFGLLAPLAFGQFSDAEKKEIARLDSIVNSTNVHDTSLAQAYLGLSEILYVSNLDTLRSLCEQAREVAERGLEIKPTPKVKKALQLSLAGALNNIGYVYKSNGDIGTALSYYEQGLKLAQELESAHAEAEMLSNVGVIYKQQGNIPLALEYYHKSLKLRELAGDKEGTASTLSNIGNIHKEQGDLELALEYFHKSLKLDEETGNLRWQARSRNIIGLVYREQGKNDKALEYFQSALNLSIQIENKKGEAQSLNNIGLVVSDEDDVIQALAYYQRALALLQQIGHKKGEGTALINIARLEIQMQAWENADMHAKQALDIAQTLGYPDDIQAGAQALSVIHKHEGRYREALELFELHIQMRDSINNEKTQKAAIRTQTKYEFEKAQLIAEQARNEEERMLNEELRRRDNLQYSIVLIGLLVIGLLIAMLGKLSLPTRAAEGLVFFAFLIFFEFILVLGDPYIESWTGGAPGLKLLINAGIAALIFPLHSFFEGKLKERLVK